MLAWKQAYFFVPTDQDFYEDRLNVIKPLGHCTQVLLPTLHNANHNEHYTNCRCWPKLSTSLTFENIKDEHDFLGYTLGKFDVTVLV